MINRSGAMNSLKMVIVKAYIATWTGKCTTTYCNIVCSSNRFCMFCCFFPTNIHSLHNKTFIFTCFSAFFIVYIHILSSICVLILILFVIFSPVRSSNIIVFIHHIMVSQKTMLLFRRIFLLFVQRVENAVWWNDGDDICTASFHVFVHIYI